jgi:hypothetical protein
MESSSTTLTLLRFLSETSAVFGNNDNSTDPNNDITNDTNIDGDQGDPASERRAYDFMAFLLWYLFLVLCCVVPTCCAYRRRRLLENRIAQSSFEQMQQQNVFILSNLHLHHHHHHHGGGSAGGMLLDLDSDQAKAERTRRIAEELKATTFVSLYIYMNMEL